MCRSSGVETALKEFYVMVRVALTKPLDSEGDPLVGYYVNIGVTAENTQKARALVSHSIRDGAIDWNESEWFDADTLGPEIIKCRREPRCPIIWYKSGRKLFPAKAKGDC